MGKFKAVQPFHGCRTARPTAKGPETIPASSRFASFIQQALASAQTGGLALKFISLLDEALFLTNHLQQFASPQSRERESSELGPMKLTPTRAKNKALFCLVLLAVGGMFLWGSWTSGPVAHGELSNQDVIAILRAVKHDMWCEAFPDFSWSTIQTTPRALLWVLSARVSEVTQTFEKGARAHGRFRLEFRNFVSTPQSVSQQRMLTSWDCWTLKREGTSWKVQSRGRTQDVVWPRPPNPMQQMGGFPQALSNSARLSLDFQPNF